MSRTKGEPDRRIRKTRKALVDSFSHLVQERSYDRIRVGDVVRDADVGRSTFYQHYSGKEDLLLESMGGILDVLAGVCLDESDAGALERILSHFWQNRTLARELFSGPPSAHVLPRITGELARRIELGIQESLGASGTTPAIAPRLIAIQTSEAQLAVIKAWLSGRGSATPGELARAMTASARASLHALVSSPG